MISQIWEATTVKRMKIDSCCQRRNYSTLMSLTKSLDAAHHRWQRSILGISWKDRITNVEVRTRTGQHTMDNILRERRLRWLGQVFRMDHKRIPQETVLAGTRIQERTRSTKSELEGRSQQRPTKDGVHLGGSRGGSS